MLRATSNAVFVVMLGLGVAGTGLADHKYHGGPLEARDHGYQHGYSDGFHQGMTDIQQHNKPKPEVRDDDGGYQKYMGDKNQYKEGYRSGFVAGYDDGFNNRPGRFSEIYGQSDTTRGSADRSEDIYPEQGWNGAHVASDIGYRDGLTAGAADYARRLDPRPEDQRDFRDGDHGYRPTYGDRVLYQQQYRNSFVQGYRDAYSGRR